MIKEKPTSRKLHSLETKTKIYGSAELLFREFGFDKVSVDSIVERAGVSKGSFYVHFESKDALFAIFLAEFIEKVDLDYKSYLESLPANTISSDILILLVGKIVDILTDTIGYERLKFLYHALIVKTVNSDAVLGYNRELYKLFNYVISQGVEKGEYRSDLPIETISIHCVMAIRGLTYEWCVRYPDFDLKNQVLTHFDLLLNGIKSQ